MKQLHWEDICPAGEVIHLAAVTSPQSRHGMRHAHDFYECFLIEEGRGLHLLPEGEQILQAGDLHFIRPEHSHGFRGSGVRVLKLTNVAFKRTCVEGFMRRHSFPHGAWARSSPPFCVALDVEQRARFVQLVFDTGNGPRLELDAEFFLAGLGRLLRPVNTTVEPAVLPRWLLEALPVLAQPENLQAGMSSLVGVCGRSPEHISRSFRKFLGQTPSAWIAGRRIHHARRLLETTNLPVLEVALESGFDSMSYFHRCFRHATGETPLKFRKRAAGVQLTQ